MNNTNDIGISFADMLAVFFKKLWIIILVGLLVGGVTFAMLASNYSELYTSKSTIMVMNPEKNLSASSSAYYYSLTITAVNDCEQLMTSRSVLYQIIEKLELNKLGINYSTLKSMVSIDNYTDSHVLEVSVTTGDPELSRDIVNLLCSLGAAQIEDYIEFATAKVIDEGTLPKIPSNTVGVEIAVIAGLAAAVAVFAICFFRAAYDDKIKTAEDIENKLGLSVLGVIPYNEGKKKKKSRRA